MIDKTKEYSLNELLNIYSLYNFVNDYINNVRIRWFYDAV